MSIPAGPNKMPPVHPGEILQEELEYLGLTARQFSLALNVPPNRISAILHGQRGITVDTALRLARYFGTSPELDFIHLSEFASPLIGNETPGSLQLKGWPCSPCRSP